MLMKMTDVSDDSLITAVGKILIKPDKSYGWSTAAMAAAKTLACELIRKDRP